VKIMSDASKQGRVDRRHFLAIGAAAGAGIVAAGLAEPALAAGNPLVADGPAKGSTPLTIMAKPLPD
jgi:hypothetical protein